MLLLLFSPSVAAPTDLECPSYFDLDCDIGLGPNIPIVITPGVDVYWNYLRRDITLDLYKTEVTFYNLRRDVILKL